MDKASEQPVEYGGVREGDKVSQEVIEVIRDADFIQCPTGHLYAL